MRSRLQNSYIKTERVFYFLRLLILFLWRDLMDTVYLRTCLVSAESGRIVENRLRSLSCQIIQAIFLERNLR